MFGTTPTSIPTADTASESRTEAPTSEPASIPPTQQAPSAPTAQTPHPQSASGAAAPARTNTPSTARAAANSKGAVSKGANATASKGASATASKGTRASAANTSANAKPPTTTADGESAGIQEVMPDVPQRARRTIRGHVRVSVRVIVEQDGSVFAALAEQRGPSRYFERLAIDAAKKWTFPAADAGPQRLMLVKFDFTRDGTTARAAPLR